MTNQRGVCDRLGLALIHPTSFTKIVFLSINYCSLAPCWSCLAHSCRAIPIYLHAISVHNTDTDMTFTSCSCLAPHVPACSLLLCARESRGVKLMRTDVVADRLKAFTNSMTGNCGTVQVNLLVSIMLHDGIDMVVSMIDDGDTDMGDGCIDDGCFEMVNDGCIGDCCVWMMAVSMIVVLRWLMMVALAIVVYG